MDWIDWTIVGGAIVIVFSFPLGSENTIERFNRNGRKATLVKTLLDLLPSYPRNVAERPNVLIRPNDVDNLSFISIPLNDFSDPNGFVFFDNLLILIFPNAQHNLFAIKENFRRAKRSASNSQRHNQ